MTFHVQSSSGLLVLRLAATQRGLVTGAWPEISVPAPGNPASLPSAAEGRTSI